MPGELVELKQENLSSCEINRLGRSGMIAMIAIAAIVLSGLPALAASLIADQCAVQTVLHSSGT